jgi:hypothetical protein
MATLADITTSRTRDMRAAFRLHCAESVCTSAEITLQNRGQNDHTRVMVRTARCLTS